MAEIPIWPGSSSFTPGLTSFGFYDSDDDFIVDADKVADWCAKRLGYPMTAIELQDINFFTAFEEAITEYGNQVNSVVSRDNLLNLLGASTGSNTQNLSQTYIESTGAVFKLADDYGTIVGAGGTSTYYTGSLSVSEGQQVYDLVTDSGVTLESGSFATDTFMIRKVHHYTPAALARYFDPFAASGTGVQGLLQEFGWTGYMPSVYYTMFPLNYDLLRLQGIEFSDAIRKSAYSFELINNRLRLFPIPTRDYTLYFEYTLDKKAGDIQAAGAGKISDYSNIPYQNMVYSQINQMGKQWIRRYTLALCKEMLGWVRGKYPSIPFATGEEVSLNGEALLNQASEEKTALLEELKDRLEQFSRQSLLERKRAEVEALSVPISKAPLGFYIG